MRENVGKLVEIVGNGREFQGTKWDWIVVCKGGKIETRDGNGAKLAFCMDWQLIPLRSDGEDKVKIRGLKIS